MEITKISVRRIGSSNPKMKGTAYVELDNCFAIENIRIIEKADGSLFAAMPSRKKPNGEFHDICHPINEETRNMFNSKIVAEYNRIDISTTEEENIETELEEE